MMIYSYPCGLELRLQTVEHSSLSVTYCGLQGLDLGRKSLGQEALDVHTFHRHVSGRCASLRFYFSLSDVKCLDLDMQRSWILHTQATYAHIYI